MSKIVIDERANLHICAACGDDLIRGEMVSHVTRVEDGVVVRKSFHPDCYYRHAAEIEARHGLSGVGQ